MKKYIFLILVSTLSFQFVYAEINLFSFVTKPQTVLPSTLSKEITIQSQSTLGLSEAVTETFDLTFTSSGATGLFLGSTGKPASKTMSKGTANRTFYYKDSSLGNFVITVVATGRDTLRSFKVTQNITISTSTTKVLETPPVIKTNPPQTQNIKPKTLQSVTISKTPVNTSQDLGTSTDATSATIVFTAPAQKGFVSHIFAWPIRFFDFLRHLFVEG